jgi:syntaxin 7
MSFEDIETGSSAGKQDRSDGVAAGIFRINTSVSTYKRLVNTLGTQRDNHALREKLHATEQKISQLVEETVSKLKEENEADHLVSSSTGKKIRDAKLAKDFQSVLLEFQIAQKAAQSRQRKYAPVLPPAASLNSGRGDSEEETSSLLQRQSQQLVVEANESEVIYNAVVIEEREQGIQEIQQQIGEVSEIFKDLAQIVANQGYVIDDIEANIESSASATVQANMHLTRAAKSQKSSEYWKCVILAIVGTVLFAFLIIMFA